MNDRARQVVFSIALALAATGCRARSGSTDAGNAVDAGVSDLAQHFVDLALPDLSPTDAGEDAMAVGSDLAPPDLATHPDLTASPDLSHTNDLAGADLAGDMACNNPCNTPPPAQCEGNAVLTYGANGTCLNGGACGYPTTTSPCTYGCAKATCTQSALSFLGYIGAYQGNATVATDQNNPGTAQATAGVSVVVQTYPEGAASAVHLVWATNANYTNQTDTVMTFDKTDVGQFNNNDQFYGVIPAQASGTQIWFYVRADGYGTMTSQYLPGGFGNNYRFTFR